MQLEVPLFSGTAAPSCGNLGLRDPFATNFRTFQTSSDLKLSPLKIYPALYRSPLISPTADGSDNTETKEIQTQKFLQVTAFVSLPDKIKIASSIFGGRPEP